jgi:membrane protein
LGLKITNYLKNLGKSVKYAAIEGFKTNYDTTYKSFDQASTATKETVNAIVNYRQTFRKAQEYLMKTSAYEASNLALKSAKEDLKSGKLWNQDRADKVMFGGDDDDFDWNFDEDSIGGDSGDSGLDITDGDRAVAKTVHEASKANADQISGTILSAAKYNADVTKQTASFMFAQQERLFGNLNNSIMGLGTTMGNMQNFMTTNMQTHIENSTKYFEESTKYQRENNAILKELLDMERERFKEWNTGRDAEKKRQDKGLKQDITDILSNGVMDWGAYGKHLKKGFIDQAENFGLGMISKEMLMGMAANPLQYIPAYLVQRAMGKPLEKAIGGFNKTLTGLFNQINADLLRSKDKEGMGGILASIFSVKIANKDKIDTSKYFKGQVPFDGMTRKSIVEVIPAYLARIESLLGGEERIYDFDKGKFSSLKILNREKERREKSYKDRAGSGIRNALEEDIKKIAKSKKLSANELKRLTDLIPDVEERLWNSNGSFDEVMEAYGDDSFGKLLRFLRMNKNSRTYKESKTLAAEYADAFRSQAEYYQNQEKAGWSPEAMMNNRSKNKGDGKSAIIANNEMMSKAMASQESIFKAMLSELYLIRTNEFRKGKKLGVRNRLNATAAPDYIDTDFIKYSVLKENRAETIEETYEKVKASNPSRPKDAPVDPDEVGKTLDEVDINKLGSVFDKGDKSKFDNVTNAKGLKGKGKAALSNWYEILKNPRLFAAEVITKVDDSLYEFFFDHETGEKDEDGEQIRGFYDKMAFELKTTFNKVRDWLDKKFWEPIVKKGWGKIKDFAKDFGLDWFNDAKDSAKNALTGAGSKLAELVRGKPGMNPLQAEALARSIMFGPAPKSFLDPEDQLKNIAAGYADAFNQSSAFKQPKPKSTTSSDKGAKVGTLDDALAIYKANKEKGYAFGSLSVPHTALTTVSKGELIIPSDLNPFNPDLDKADRKKDKQDELRLRNKILSHAEGGNLLDTGKNFLQTVKDKAPEGMIQGNTVREVVGSALEFAVGKLSGKVESTDGSALGQAAKATVSAAWETGLNKVEDYAKTIDPEVGKALSSDIAKLRGNSAKFAGRTGVAAGAGALGATAIFGPGGLLAGAAIGAAANIIRESDTAKNFLFGKEMADGSREGGLISRKQQALFKKYMPDLGKGAAAGIIPSLMLGFGPVGAIAIGGAYSLAKNNQKVNEKIFGKTYYDKDGNEIGRKDGLIPKKVQDYVKKNIPKIAGFGGAAALLDPTGMGLLMNFGLGAGLGLIGTSSKFHDMILGKKNEDGEREGGLVGALKDNVVDPLRRFGTTLYQDFYKFMDYNLFSPLKGTGKMLAQVFKNMGRSMKYGLFNILEKAFGGPFSMLIGKQVNDMLLKPLGKLLGTTFTGIGDLAKFAIGTPIRGFGWGLRKINNWGNAKIIRRGTADHLSARERLNIMGTENYANKEFDTHLANSSAKDLGELEDNLSVLNSRFKIGGGDTRKEVKSVEKQLSKYMDASSVKKLVRMVFDGDMRGASAFISDLNLDSKSSKEVISIVTKGIERIAVAKGKKKFSDKEVAKASAYLKKFNINPADRKSLGVALNQVRNERDKADTAERLVGANGEKFTSEEAANVAEGMQTTNNLLKEIRDALIKSENGGFDDKYFSDQDKMAVAAQSVMAINNIDAKSQKLIEKDLSHLKITGSKTDFITGNGKKNRQNLKALKAMPKGMEIDLDILSKLSTKTIKRYSQLAMVMGPIAIKSIGDPSALAPEKLADGAFASIVKIATYLSRGDKKFEFTEPISKYIRMPEDKLEFLAMLVGYGMDPSISATDADWAWKNRSVFDNGSPNAKVEFAKSFNKPATSNAAGTAEAAASTVAGNAANIAPNTAAASQANEIAQTGTSQHKERSVDADGNETYESTDGSKNKADTESAHDKKKEEDAKDEKNAERQGSIFSKALGKLKGFGDSAKEGAKNVKEKSQGFLHDMVDGIFGKGGGLFGGLGTILGGGLLLSFLAPMLPEIGKILTHTLLPAIGGFLKNTVIPLFVKGVGSALGGLLDGFIGKEEQQETDENGNPVFNPDGTPKMKTTYNPTLGGMAVNGGVLGFLGYKTFKAGRVIYKGVKGIGKGIGGSLKLGKAGFSFAKELKRSKSFGKSWRAGKFVYKNTKLGKDIGKIAKSSEDAVKASRLGKLSSSIMSRAFGASKEGLSKIGWAIRDRAGVAGSALLDGTAKRAVTSSGLFSKAADFVKSGINKVGEVASKAADKTMDFLKEILTKGIEKISTYIPKLAEKGAQFAPKLATMILDGIKGSAKFAKLLAKAGTYVGVTAITAGIGGIVIGIITALDLAASVTTGISRWYNVAECLADEQPPNDDVKWVAGLASAVDSVLFGVIGPQLFFKILAYIWDLNDVLAPMQQRALAALNQYNQTAEKKLDSIEEYNDEIYDKDKGFIDDIKTAFGGSDSNKKNPAYKPNAQQLASQTPATPGAQGTGKKGPLGAGSGTANGNGLLSGMQSDMNKLSQGTSGLMGNLVSQAGDLQAQVLGTGKFFKQKDPRYANIGFNTSGDSINQTIGDSGCGPVAGANALMALGTGTINPAEASSFALSGGYKGTDTGVAPSFFEGYAARHGATSYSTDAQGTINALKSGNPVVLQGESKSGTSNSHPFGSYPHYVTATGYDASTGKVTIQDPESNRDNATYNIKDVLRNTTTANAFGRGRLYGRGKFSQGIRFGRGIEGNVPIIWNKLQGLGFGDIHTAAIMGNMAIESGFDPAISEIGGGGGFGLCQWDDRKGNLAEYAQRAGKDPSDLDIQLQFIKYELQGSESVAASEFFAETSNIDKATEIFCRKYERPNMAYANLEGRKQAAREILQSKGTGKVTSIAGGKAGASGPTKKPGLLSPLFDMYNSIKSNLGSVLGIDLGGNIGGSSGAVGGVGGAVGGGNTKAASNWADSIVGKKDYGNNGCTSFVNEYLQQAGQSTIDLNCDNAYLNSKNNGQPYAWKPGKDNGVEGDVALINTAEDGSFPDGVPKPDHAVIADGRGGYWGYSASQKNTVHGKMTDWGDGGSNIIGYIASGGSGNGAQLSGDATMSQTDMMKASSDDYGLGKNGLRFGRAKGVSKEVQMAVEGRQNIEAGFKMAKDQARQAAKLGMGTEGVPEASSSDSQEVILLRAIYNELTKITGNTAGIGTLQANQAQTQQQVTTVQTGLQGAMATLGNKLNEKINMVSQNIQGQVNKVTKNVSGNTINQLQYLASK